MHVFSTGFTQVPYDRLKKNNTEKRIAAYSMLPFYFSENYIVCFTANSSFTENYVENCFFRR